MNLDTYRGWLIGHDYPPIPVRDFDWSATSPDYDADCDQDGFYQCGGERVTAATRDALLVEIDAAIDDVECPNFCDDGIIWNNADPTSGQWVACDACAQGQAS